MTTDQYIASLKSIATKLQSGAALQKAAQSVHADRVERIFDIGSVARGYTPKYAHFKAAKGFDSSVVNFRLTNDLQMDFANSRVNPRTGTPDAGEVIKVNNALFVEELRSNDNIDKLKWNIDRFGNFIEFTTAERAKFDKIITLELNATLQGER